MIMGITGSFGTGKTTVANMFKKYGFRVINVDKLYRGIYNKNKNIREKIKKEFGTLNRNQIKKIVFNDSKKLRKLNDITHPLIIKEIMSIISTSNKKISIIKNSNKKTIINKNKYIGNKKIIIDAPLLIEARAESLVDKLIVVKCSKKNQIQRALKKGKYTKKEIENIIKSQMPLKEKIKHADFVVDNSKTMKETKKQVREIINIVGGAEN